MEQLEAVLRAHLSRYPGMEVQDCIKLIYQNEMGGGHLVTDEAAFTNYLVKELAEPDLFFGAPFQADPIGNGLYRVHLSAFENGPSPEVITRLAARAAKRGCHGSRQQLHEKLLWLRHQIDEGRLPYAKTAVAAIDEYIAGNYGQPHHSGRYRALYAPHYRLLDEDALLYLPVFAAIDARLEARSHVLVGIDGMSNAGKSTLSALLQLVYGCGIVHADHFFLQPHQRNTLRMMEPGGNIDYERLAPVAEKAAVQNTFQYPVFSCQTGTFDGEHVVRASALTVLEGAYCLHPKIAAPCDLRVFLMVDSQVQARRVVRRNGPVLAQRFLEEWIPLENRYFNEFKIRETCDVIIDTSSLQAGTE